mmetsp:Transcript_23057/g.68619  ORF Transcript_23057/g.68619 Transcript_23057/m.68619 type:complete len:206 (-) Transcript_23057:413-1030(-)
MSQKSSLPAAFQPSRSSSAPMKPNSTSFPGRKIFWRLGHPEIHSASVPAPLSVIRLSLRLSSSRNLKLGSDSASQSTCVSSHCSEESSSRLMGSELVMAWKAASYCCVSASRSERTENFFVSSCAANLLGAMGGLCGTMQPAMVWASSEFVLCWISTFIAVTSEGQPRSWYEAPVSQRPTSSTVPFLVGLMNGSACSKVVQPRPW